MNFKLFLQKSFFLFLIASTLPLTALEHDLGHHLKSKVELHLDTLNPKPAKIVSRTEKPAAGATEITFANGVTVCLRPVDGLEQESISIEAFAAGGAASSPAPERSAARLAPYLAWESGIGSFKPKDISSFLLDYGMDFSITIRPYYRRMRASCTPEHIDLLIRYIHFVFTEQNISREALPEAKTLFVYSDQTKVKDAEYKFDEAFKAINSSRSKTLKPVSRGDIEKITFEDASATLKNAFGDPSQFTFLVVGNFDIEKIIPAISKFIGSFKPVDTSTTWKVDSTASVPFPKGQSVHNVVCSKEKDSLTRITFPLSLKLTPRSLFDLDGITQVIETRLRQVIRNEMGTTQGVDVSYEFPLFPTVNTVWLSVQFRSRETSTNFLIDKAIKELENLRTVGPSEQELQAVKLLRERVYKYWTGTTFFWYRTLRNFYMWGWDISEVEQELASIDSLDYRLTMKILNENLSLNDYTIISMICPK